MSIRGKVKKREEKKEGQQKQYTSTLGSCNEDRHGILYWRARVRLFARVSFITQSPPSVTPLGDLYGSSSRKFVSFCAGASGGKTSRWVC